MNKIKSLTLVNAFSFFIHAGLFYCIHFQLINQISVREITNPYDSLFAPPPVMSFKIWGFIYTALTIFCLYHIRKAFSRPEKYTTNQDTVRVNIFFIITNLAAAGWLIMLLIGQVFFSLVLLAVQLIALFMIHHRLHIYKRYRRVRSNVCIQIPLSIYAGWLTIIAVAGISDYAGLSTERWTLILIGASVFISLLFVFIRHNIFFVLPVIAALYGLILKNESKVHGIYDIRLTAWIAIGVLAIACVIKLVIDFLLKEPASAVFHRTAYD